MEQNFTVAFDSALYNKMDPAYMEQVKGQRTLYVKGSGRWDECYNQLSPFTKARETFLR